MIVHNIKKSNTQHLASKRTRVNQPSLQIFLYFPEQHQSPHLTNREQQHDFQTTAVITTFRTTKRKGREDGIKSRICLILSKWSDDKQDRAY